MGLRPQRCRRFAAPLDSLTFTHGAERARPLAEGENNDAW